MRWLLVVLLLSPHFAFYGQTRRTRPAPKAEPVAPAAWPIERLRVEGNHNYSQEQVLAVAGLTPGLMAGKAEFEAARDRLLATGAFESVGYKFEPAPNSKGYAASFQVVEVSQVFPMRFEDLDVPAQQIEEWLRRTEPLYSAKIPGTQAVLDHYARAISKFLETKNRKVQVAGKLSADSPNEIFALFRPAGALPSVAEVKFTGNQVIPTYALQNAVASSAVGIVYNEARFRQTLDASIRPLYDARGRIRVSFPKIQVEPAKGVNGLVVTVAVSEGESYKLGEVKVDGPGLPAAELLKAGNFKTGDLADFDRVREGVDRIKTRLGGSGYMHPKIDVERQIKDEAKSVDLVLHIDPGPQYLFGKLSLVGLDLDGEAQIRRLWALKEGAPFKADYPEFFLARVKEGGFFDNLKQTRAVIKADDQAHRVDVTLVFNK